MKHILTLFAISTALFAAPAEAQNPAFADRSQVVSTADLDLSIKADQAKLDRRINLAVRDACGSASDVDPEGKNDVRQCRIDTARQAVASRDQVLAAAREPSTTLASSR